MKKIWLGGRDDKVKRVGAVYYKDRYFPDCMGARKGMVFRTMYNCDGKCVANFYSSKCGLEIDGVPQTVLIQGFGFPTWTNVRGVDITVDTRTLKQMQDDCCPPELMIDFLREEREETDAVEEAMKLRKRGYFGG